MYPAEKPAGNRMRPMTKSQNRNFSRAPWALIAASFAAALGAAAPAAATPNYDGLWSVVIVTEKGSCDRAYRYPVRISNGAVHNDGTSATGTGKLFAKLGGGKWSGGECAGTWQAERRD